MSGLRRGRARALVVALWLGAFLLLSCQPAQPLATPKPAEKASEKPVRGGTLSVGYQFDPATLDPQQGLAQPHFNVVFEPLIEPDKDGNLTKEGLAKDWTIGGDGKSITLKLREGVKFHDGTALDAAAVKWNIERIKDPATKGTFAFNYAAVASVEVVDGLTVRVNLKQPDALFTTRLAMQGGMMVSPAAVQKLGQDFGRKPVGSGAFQFVEWVAGDHITYKRFDGYWGKDKAGNQLPYLDGVVYKILPDPSVALANLRTGQLDVYDSTYIPAEHLPVLKADANLTYATYLAVNSEGVNLNTKKPPFDKKALRQAVALALDREGMAASLGELTKPLASIYVPANWGNDGKAGVFPSRDLAKAKAKVAEAGYSGGLKLKYQARQTSEIVQAAQIVKANLAEIGIDLEIEVLATAAWITKVNVVGADYQIANGNLANGLPDPGHIFGLQFHSQGTRNYWGPYTNPQFDQLVEKAGSIYDQKEREALYQQAANIVAEDVFYIPLTVTSPGYGINKKVRDFAVYAHKSNSPARTWLAK